jgi:glucose/arabinose dehydrogenase
VRRSLAALALAGLVLAGCSDDEPDASTTTSTESTVPPTTGTSTPEPGLNGVELRLTEVERFDQPLAMTWCAGRTEPLVAEKGGTVRTLGGDELLVLQVSAGNEQGLLGIACAPDGSELVVSYTDRDGDTRVEAYALPDPTAAAPRTIFTIDQPAANHNGGNVLFGPDGRLWLGLGDGGGRDDRFENAQQPGEPLGAMLRLDLAGGEPEIVVKGVRNPWRWSFDRETGDLWIGDVGQDELEEIDRLPAGAIDGANLGWPAFEGSQRYRDDVEVEGAVPPVFEYGRDEGQSIVGGYVYRGTRIEGLQGAFLFADTYAGELRALTLGEGTALAERRFGEVPGGQVASFAEDPDGELYVLSLDGGIYRLDPA